MMKKWTGTICNVEIPNFDPDKPETFKVKKTPIDKDTPAEVIYRRQSRVADAVNAFFQNRFNTEANIPKMDCNNGSIEMQQVVGQVLGRMDHYELISLPEEALEELKRWITAAYELKIDDDFLDIWGFDPEKASRFIDAVRIRASTNLMHGFVMDEIEPGRWERSKEGFWFVDPDTYKAACTNPLSRTFMPLLKPTVANLFCRQFKRKYLKALV